MSDLRAMLQRSSSGATRALDVDGLWNAATRRARRAHMLTAVGVLILVGASSVVAADLDLVDRGVNKQPIGGGTDEPTKNETPAQDERNSKTCSMDSVMCIKLDRPWSIVGGGFGTAWVGNIGGGKTFGIARFDAETGEETARLRTHGFVKGFASDERWMWALVDANDHLSLLRIDPETTEVAQEFDIAPSGNVGDASVVAGGGYVWVSGRGGTLARLSSVEGERSNFSYGDALPGYIPEEGGPLHLAYGEDRLWLSYGTGHVGVVDPQSGELIRVDKDALGVNAYNIVVAAGYLWSSHQTPPGANVLTYAPTDGSTEGRGQVHLQQAVPGLAASDGTHIWVVQEGFDENEPGWLVEVDAETRQVVGEPIELAIEFQGTVAVGDGYVWVTGKNVLYRINQ